jgi:ubiquinone/menaquinone biosynthesis C-methylase UbiE
MSKTNTQHKADRDLSVPRAAFILKAAGDELRSKILRVLQRDAFGVLELGRIFAVRQPAMSHHLKILSTAGLVVSRREGTCIFYRRNSNQKDGFDTLRQQIFSHLDLCPVAKNLDRKIKQIHTDRSAKSLAFFRDNADRFSKQQDLIASYALYGNTVIELIDALHMPSTRTIMEVGPGEGELLPELATRFDKVIAIDNSAELLERAKSLVARAHTSTGDNIEFILGDINARHDSMQADLVLLNMVLHHLAHPADTLKDIGALLPPGGALIVTELCQHNQEWAHSACGDLWLGFCPEELGLWAVAAGLVEGKSVFLTQRNGFQIQSRQFLKAVAS